MARRALVASLIAFSLSALPFLALADEEDQKNPIAALEGYSVRVWAEPDPRFTNPDSIEIDAKRDRVWVGYQNVTAKDGTDGKSSTVVEYNLDGKVKHTYSVLGHCDGLRVDPATHKVWATSNEDGNPRLVSIDPATHVVTAFTFPSPTAHGGGFDDMAFLGGKMFIAASNPTLDSSGVNVFPAVDAVTFSGHNVVLTPVLLGNATATDTLSGSQVTLNEIDPDSMTIDAAGNLVLVNQAGSELVFIHNPGTSTQTVARTLVGTQLEDTIFIGSARQGKTGTFLLVDGGTNTIYSIRTKLQSVYTETPNDSGVVGLFGTLDLSSSTATSIDTGIVTPVVIGFNKATGLALFPQDSGDE
jgi:sugar lactone lactonase YvrE